ncbi:MAG: Gldg family protein [Planctomycetota bacterium]
MRSLRWISLSGLGLAAVLFLAVNLLSTELLRGFRVDLTDHHLYTLSDGSRKIAASLEEPIRMRYFFSQKVSNQIPGIKAYAQRVEELLREYVLESGGRIKLEIIDPEPFSEEEDQAVQAGLQGEPVTSAGDRFYFGLYATNSVDDQEAIPFFDPRQEGFLEYDISKLIYRLAHPEKPAVGILTSLPMDGGPPNPFGGGAGQPPWAIMSVMRELFSVRMLGPRAEEIPDDLNVLMLVHPKGLSDETFFAIDQYILRGGKALILVDPFCEADQPPRDPNNPMAGLTAPRSSQPEKLFDAWGLELVKDKIVGDRQDAQRVRARGPDGRPQVVDYILWLGLGKDSFNQEDLLTSQLGSVNLGTAGALRKKEGASIEISPLLESSQDSMLVDRTRVQFMPDPGRLLDDFRADDQKYALAVRVSGILPTAFPDGPPKTADESKDKESPETKGEVEEESKPAFLKESKEPANLVVIADADLLSDHFWVQQQDFFGQKVSIPLADNGDFVVNALDNLSGSNELIGIRSHGLFARPFEKVQELQRDAEQRFRAREQVLEQKLRDTEQRLSELQSQKEGSSKLILSPEQGQEIEKFQNERLAIRKQLRDVQHDLQKDIESLGSWLKAINMGLIPLLIGVFALGLGAYRMKHRRR